MESVDEKWVSYRVDCGEFARSVQCWVRWQPRSSCWVRRSKLCNSVESIKALEPRYTDLDRRRARRRAEIQRILGRTGSELQHLAQAESTITSSGKRQGSREATVT